MARKSHLSHIAVGPLVRSWTTALDRADIGWFEILQRTSRRVVSSILLQNPRERAAWQFSGLVEARGGRDGCLLLVERPRLVLGRPNQVIDASR